jgi:hypothetical protein
VVSFWKGFSNLFPTFFQPFFNLFPTFFQPPLVEFKSSFNHHPGIPEQPGPSRAKNNLSEVARAWNRVSDIFRGRFQ